VPDAERVAVTRLAVRATDPFTEFALVNFVRLSPRLTLVPWNGPADVAVAVVDDPEVGTLQALHDELLGDPDLILIVQGQWSVNLHVALENRVQAVLFRADFTWERFNESLRQVREGHVDLPAALQGQLTDKMRQTQPEVLAPGDLTVREVDVLRLVAEGYELQEIGAKLGYSERTIKNVLYGVIKRYRLRNRAHAVAFVLRRGLI
jgi:DNA-binding NarL/FixJ family response regulator